MKNPAVMEQRAPAQVDADSAQRRRWRELDYFATPPWATRAVCEIIRQVDPEAETAWDGACGDGIQARVMEEYFKEVWATDICPQGYGQEIDFFNIGETRYDWLITNPPFSRAAEFVEQGLKKVNRGVAILGRLAFVESEGRYGLHNRFLTDMCPFAERVPMELGPWNPDCRSATAYAWYLFDKNGETSSEYPVLRIIPPGTRSRLWYATDVTKFGQRKYLPLLDGRV